MKRNLDNFIGCTIGGTDGKIGKVKEFYFDDASWTIRYIIVETGSWLEGRKVLLSPQSIVNTDWKEKILNVDLTMEQVKNSPDIDTDQPVFRQQERDLYSYYPWGGSYWGGIREMDVPDSQTNDLSIQQENELYMANNVQDNPNLRSTAKVTSYSIKAADGVIGDVEDLIINDKNWQIDFMVIDTGKWFSGKKVLIMPKKMIVKVNWEASSIMVNTTKDVVKRSPKYESTQVLNDSFEANVESYYKRSAEK